MLGPVCERDRQTLWQRQNTWTFWAEAALKKEAIILSSEMFSAADCPSFGLSSHFLSSEATPPLQPGCQWLALPWPSPCCEAICPGGRTLTRQPGWFRANIFHLKWDLDHPLLLPHSVPGPGQVSACLLLVMPTKAYDQV